MALSCASMQEQPDPVAEAEGEDVPTIGQRFEIERDLCPDPEQHKRDKEPSSLPPGDGKPDEAEAAHRHADIVQPAERAEARQSRDECQQRQRRADIERDEQHERPPAAPAPLGVADGQGGKEDLANQHVGVVRQEGAGQEPGELAAPDCTLTDTPSFQSFVRKRAREGACQSVGGDHHSEEGKREPEPAEQGTERPRCRCDGVCKGTAHLNAPRRARRRASGVSSPEGAAAAPARPNQARRTRERKT